MKIIIGIVSQRFKKVFSTNKIALLLFSTIFLFSGCSWQQYFVISNETLSDITIEYSIPIPSDGFGIFNTSPILYKLNSSGSMDWDNQLSIIDNDTSLFAVKIVLPPKSAVVIGELSNDNYETHNQKFINGRIFNLEKIILNKNGNFTEITPENFDIFFKKTSGNIEYTIK